MTALVTIATAGGVETVHPSYAVRADSWQKLADAFQGEDHVKAQTIRYLPATSGMIEDGYGKSTASNNPGYLAYCAYCARAVFPDFISDAVKTLAGILCRKPASIKVPKALEAMLDHCTPDGESVYTLLRRIHEGQLLYGRYGMLLDAPTGATAGAMPYVAGYCATAIRNWDTGIRDQGMRKLELVVLDESGYVREGNGQWVHKARYRVVTLEDVIARMAETDQSSVPLGRYQSAVLEPGQGFAEGQYVIPTIAGKALERIPFVFVNPNDLVAEPDLPPLLGLANLCYAIYRGEADYRQSLHMQSQDTLVLLGKQATREGEKPGEAEVKVGAGAIIQMKEGSDAKYIGVSSTGLGEMRSAIENDRSEAGQMSGRLLDNRSRDAESGDSLRTRLTARTASLSSMAKAAAAGLSEILKAAAEWVGANPDEVEVEANTDFADDAAAAEELNQLMDAKVKGAPLSRKSVHVFLQKREYTAMTFEEEEEELAKERTELGIDGEAEGDLDPAGGKPAPKKKPKDEEEEQD